MKSWKKWALALALVVVPASAYAAERVMNDSCGCCGDRCECESCGCEKS